MPIRESVTFDEVREALRPLYALLGTSDINVYNEPGITIGLDKITFMVPASIGTVVMTTERAKGVRLPREYPHPQAVEVGRSELAYVVTVRIDGVPGDDLYDVREGIRSIRDRLEDIVHAFDPLDTTNRKARHNGGRS